MFLNKAQVWVETAVYTLIGMAVITIILIMAMPQIDRIKDKSIVEQTIVAMNTLNGKMVEIEQSPGNTRVVEFKVSGGGSFEIDGEKDLIKYVIDDTKLEITEEGEEIKEGNVIIKTKKRASKYEVTLLMRYDNINISYNGEDLSKTLNSGPTPYKIIIENKDINPGPPSPSDKINLDFSVI